MANVNDYVTGKILTDTKWAFFLLKFLKIPVLGSRIKSKLLAKVNAFEPKLINIKKAAILIKNAKKCAAGERVCRQLYKNTELTESIFLDELAEGMVLIAKAQFVSQEKAINILQKYQKNPLILSKVTDKYQEICRSWPEKCVYWNMQKYGLKCLTKG